MEPHSPSHESQAVHVPVMVREVLAHLRLAPGMVVVDGTAGAGGHSSEILKAIGPQGRLIGLDRDPMMLAHAAKRVAGENVSLHHASYVKLPAILAELKIDAVDRILLDLGLSSDQLSDRSRGFGFSSDGPLDLRFDISTGQSAADLLAQGSAEQLEEIFREYGEEPLARPLAEYLVKLRSTRPIRTGLDLTTAVSECPSIRRQGPSDKNPATRVFQALRIAVNHELDHVQQGIASSCFQSLKVGGLLAVITFHSLEDRIVKNEFRQKQRWDNLTSKPIVASPQEQRFNPRCRSAKLRVAMKKA
ncbi:MULTISPECIES: 16S rRNA (cytosine(1402)-N(4))-methyltransferase RsmH [unclassified Schlesneria]|uniref:16S rRNA (cytosine(1402)-N(4))-methyltransferase RsmH n=1 Tax=unclassified Schlesneria TaxID=2762017 RepID=UPI002F06AFFB